MNNQSYTPILNSSNNLGSNNQRYSTSINNNPNNLGSNIQRYSINLNNIPMNVGLSHQMSNTNSNYLNNQNPHLNYNENIQFNNSVSILLTKTVLPDPDIPHTEICRDIKLSPSILISTSFLASKLPIEIG